MTLEWDGLAAVVRDVRRDGDTVTAVIDGARLRAKVVERGDVVYVVRGPSTVRFTRVDDTDIRDEASGASGVVRAPLPGRVTAVLVANGDRVKAGQPLVVVEAMKMEHTLTAGAAGTVEQLGAEVGAQVEEGAALLVVA